MALALGACSGGRCGGAASSGQAVASSGQPQAEPAHAPAVAPPPLPPAPYRVMWHQVFEADIDAAATFYADVVGWKTKKDGSDHFFFIAKAGPVADIQRITDAMKSGGVRPYWGTIVQVADVDATTDLARSHGARVVFGPMDAAGTRVASFMDGEGAVFSIARWNPPLPPRNRWTPGEFLWDEIVTRNATETTSLLHDLFSWTHLSELPTSGAGKYVVFARDGIPVAGMFADPSLQASGWMSYIHVSDLESAMGRATRAGATVMLGPQAAGDERFAQLRDPEGAIFGLREAPPDTR
jgi:predicted enzyme related to lactoylglutathione lyase